jgi:N-acetylglucosamine kinase-like BadF-type ATPase
MYLGVDGGGTKTAFVLADDQGRVLASHQEGSLYHPEVGLDGVLATLRRGMEHVARASGVAATALHGAWVGLPAFGEDSRVQARLQALPAEAFPGVPVGRGNDLECSHAGALGGADGISLVAGTGAMTWGTWQGCSVRCGGWGEVFGDEGSAYWIAREGLALFSRMSDGRAPRGVLLDIVRRRTGIASDLDLSGLVVSEAARSSVASYAVSVHEAALAGDAGAREILVRAAGELAQLVRATRSVLGVPAGACVVASTSGSVLGDDGLVLQELKRALAAPDGDGAITIELRAPLMAPAFGAVALAARTAGRELSPAAVAALARTQAGPC